MSGIILVTKTNDTINKYDMRIIDFQWSGQDYHAFDRVVPIPIIVIGASDKEVDDNAHNNLKISQAVWNVLCHADSGSVITLPISEAEMSTIK